MLTIDYLWILHNNVHFYVDVKMAAVYSRKDLWEKYHGGSRIYLQYHYGWFLSIVT